MVGAPLKSIGMHEISGHLTPLSPGLYFMVRLDQVEYVWPGFTEGTFPLVICKVSYVGIDRWVKPGLKDRDGEWVPGEWVASSRLRPAMAAPNLANPAWKGWEVTDGACGTYEKDKFKPLVSQTVSKDEVVECLFPYSLKKKKEEHTAIQVEPPPPRMLDVASAVMAHELLLSGDPDGDGIWDQATPHLLTALPQLLIKLRNWDVLFGRVWGSLPYMALVVLEHGPDALCALMDLTRAGLQAQDDELLALQGHPKFAAYASSWKWVGGVGASATAPRDPGALASGEPGDDAGSAAEEEGQSEGKGGRSGQKLFALHREFVYLQVRRRVKLSMEM